MKKTGMFACIMLLTGLALQTARAQSTAPAGAAVARSKATLADLVKRLQSAPADDALRERIIKRSLRIKKRLVIPEQARQSYIEGETIVKSAKSQAQEALAVDSFQKALAAAPWWGDAYYDLATAQELAGRYDDAQAALKFYLMTGPSEKDARAAQDRIYALDAKKKLAAAQASAPTMAAAQQKADDDRFLASLEGVKFLCYDGMTTPDRDGRDCAKEVWWFEVKGGILHYLNKIVWLRPDYQAFVGSAKYPGKLWMDLAYDPFKGRMARVTDSLGRTFTAEISADGATLTPTGVFWSSPCQRVASLPE